jgi:drug/metabolite transporter (DMT)-like permease
MAAGASGLCWGGALGMMFWGYKYEEASRASAIIHTFPVFVAILAVTVLGETLVAGQWVAIIVVVAGAFTISLRTSNGGKILRLTRAFPILIGASMFTALALLTGKYALEELSVWLVFSLRNYGMVVVFVFLWRPGAFGELFRAVRNWRTMLLLLLAEYSLAPLAVVLNVTATSLGPVSLVSTLTATRPVFVFIFGSILSVPALRLLDEPLDRPTLLVKLVAIIMVVSGIAALTLL